MKYIIIGLGNYGFKLAEDLSAIGCEVIGVDVNDAKVEAIKDKVATAFTIDATDEQALAVLPLHTVDVVMVTIGENFGASVRVVALLKKLQVAHIYARAIDAVHQSVLEAFNLDRILTPERDAAQQLIQQLEFAQVAAISYPIENDYYVVKFALPDRFIGFAYNELNWDSEFGIKIIGIIRGKSIVNCLGIQVTDSDVINSVSDDDEIRRNDILVCYGRQDYFKRLWKKL